MLLFSDQVSIFLIILESILCTCFSLCSTNSHLIYLFLRTWITGIAWWGCKGHFRCGQCHVFSGSLCLLQLLLINITCGQIFQLSSSSNWCSPIYYLHFSNAVNFFVLQYFIPFLLPNSLLFSMVFAWQCS